jgi:hypothetical protein
VPRPTTTTASARPPVPVPSRRGPRPVPPPLITRRPPPPSPVPFEQRQRAMIEHPGRPLEPQQIQNLLLGRPVGRMLDREFPPHPAAISRQPLPVGPPLEPVKPPKLPH